MDLNYLLSRHQIAIVRSERAACSSSRASHAILAGAYAARIRTLQATAGATAILG